MYKIIDLCFLKSIHFLVCIVYIHLMNKSIACYIDTFIFLYTFSKNAFIFKEILKFIKN